MESQIGEQNLARAKVHFEKFMETIGVPPDSSEHLKDTPGRVSEAFIEELFSGLQVDPTRHLERTFTEGIENILVGDAGWVIQDNIRLQSVCSHHFLPFHGRAHVGYIPTDEFVGLSKLARLTDEYARRPQFQERLTNQIADAIQSNLEPIATVVVIEAVHFCMAMRGVREPHSITRTSALRGKAHPENEGYDPAVKEEFFEMVKNGADIR